MQLGHNKSCDHINFNFAHDPISTVLLAELYGKLIYLKVTMISQCNDVYPLRA